MKKTLLATFIGLGLIIATPVFATTAATWLNTSLSSIFITPGKMNGAVPSVCIGTCSATTSLAKFQVQDNAYIANFLGIGSTTPTATLSTITPAGTVGSINAATAVYVKGGDGYSSNSTYGNGSDIRFYTGNAGQNSSLATSGSGGDFYVKLGNLGVCDSGCGPAGIFKIVGGGSDIQEWFNKTGTQVASMDSMGDMTAGTFIASSTIGTSIFPIAQITSLKDSTSSTGTNGYVLQTNGTNATWVSTSSLNISGGGGGSGTVSSGTQGQNAFYNANGTTVSGTSTIFTTQASNVGIGTTSPWATFAINPVGGVAANQFVIGSSTATNFVVNNSGAVGIGTSSPNIGDTLVLRGQNAAGSGGLVFGPRLRFSNPGSVTTDSYLATQYVPYPDASGNPQNDEYVQLWRIGKPGTEADGFKMAWTSELPYYNPGSALIGTSTENYLTVYNSNTGMSDFRPIGFGTNLSNGVTELDMFKTQAISISSSTDFTGRYLVYDGANLNFTGRIVVGDHTLATAQGSDDYGVQLAKGVPAFTTANTIYNDTSGALTWTASSTVGGNFNAAKVAAGGQAQGNSVFQGFSNQGNTGMDLTVNQSSASAPVQISLQHGRGSVASPSAVQNGDAVAAIAFRGYVTGTAYNTGARIRSYVNGTVGATTADTDLVLGMSTNSSAVADKIRFTSTGKISVTSASTSPWGYLDIDSDNTDSTSPFEWIGSGSTNTPIWGIMANGNIGIATTTPGTLLSLGSSGGTNISVTGTSTLATGLNLKTGCLTYNGGACITSGSGSSQWTTSGSNIYYLTGNVGAGTSTPWGTLSASSTSTTAPALAVEKIGGFGPIATFQGSTGVGIGSTSPQSTLSVTGYPGSQSNIFTVASTTASTYFGYDSRGHLFSSGGAPTLTTGSGIGGCGTSPTINGNDISGTVTLGASPNTECTITFKTAYASTPKTIMAFGDDFSTGVGTIYNVDWSRTDSTKFTIEMTGLSSKFSYFIMQ